MFDENLVRNQDDELNLRLIRSGGRIWQSPGIVSWYTPRAEFSGLFRQYFQYGYWKVAVIRKHRLPGSWRHLVPVAFVLANIFLLTAWASSAAAGSGSSVLAGRVWLAMAAAYAAANLGASWAAAARAGWATLWYLPAIFTVYHFSWGLGFLAGFRWFLPSSFRSGATGSMFTRLSR